MLKLKANTDDTAAYIRPFIPLTLSLMAGIGTGTWIPGHGLPVLAAALVTFAALVMGYLRARPVRFLPLFLFVLLGYLSIQPWISPVISSNHILNYVDADAVAVTGRVCESPVVSTHRVRFILDVEHLDGSADAVPVRGRVQVTLMGKSPAPALGDRIRFRGKLRSFRNFQNPGGFNYVRYMMFRGIRAGVYTTAKKMTILENRPYRGKTRIDHARQSIGRLIDGTAPSSNIRRTEETRAVLKALIIGDRTGITPFLQEAVNRAGIGHILAISGLHIGIVAAFFFFLFRWGLSFFPPLLWSGRTRSIAAVLTLIPVLIYGLLAGMSPSTQRAVIMVAVFLLTYLAGRRHEPVNTLAVAALLILVIHPPSLFSISFQLSFVSVFTIVVGLSRLYRPPSPDLSRLQVFRIKIKTLVLVSLLATAGTLPLVASYFNRLSLIGPLSNLLLVPMVGFGVLPLGLLAVFLFPISTLPAVWLMEIAGWILHLALYLVHLLAAIPFAAVGTVIPSIPEIILYFLLLGTLANLKQRTWAKYVLAAVIIAIGADILYWSHERFWHRDLRVTAVDVGQGSAVLVEFPGGRIALVDGGGFYSNDAFDVGKNIVAPFLLRKKIITVDDIVLTHPDSDHMNGLVHIAGHFSPTRIICNNEPASTRSYRRFMETIQSNDIAVPDFEILNRRWMVNGVEIRMLHPPADFMKRRATDVWRDIDNNSLAMKIRWKAISVLFTGDIGARAERELIARYPKDTLAADVLLVPHHGSRSSSTPGFIEKVTPKVAVISVGYRNRYAMPHPTVLRRYHAAGARIFRTDLDGAVTVSTNGEDLRVRTARSGSFFPFFSLPLKSSAQH